MPEYWSRIEAAYKVNFKSEVDQLPQNTQRNMKRAKKTGHWLSVMPSHVGGIILSSTEFHDALTLIAICPIEWDIRVFPNFQFFFNRMGHKEDFYAFLSQLHLDQKKRFRFNQVNLPVTNFLNIAPDIHFFSKTKIRKDVFTFF